ncbi:MAG: hypothetical protein HQ562_01335 [Candidatus Marinimicrobia bacterium]|nr:hypothetical protein [Candidatus Neomarinimicrobiota bacterium]
MKQNYNRTIKLFFRTLFLIIAGTSALLCQQAGLQVSTYFDSNVREALTNTDQSLGFKLRGNLSHQVVNRNWLLEGSLLTQTYIDAISPAQSKLVVNSGLGLRYNLTPVIQAAGVLDHFQKSFYEAGFSYRWIDYALVVYAQASSKFNLSTRYSQRSTNYATLDSIKFLDQTLELRFGWRPGSRWLLEGLVAGKKITFHDYPAQGVVDDTALASLSASQEDRARTVQIHGRYHHRLILGTIVSYEAVTSNSVIGGYNLLSGRIYLSCRLGKDNMLHFIIQRVAKNYRRGDLSGVTAYRDPEERIQNRTYLQLERKINQSSIVYFQVSHLANETLLNQNYYNKTMLELGFKYKL